MWPMKKRKNSAASERGARNPYPLEVPAVVRNGWGRTALLAVLAFPIACLLGALAEFLGKLIFPDCERCITLFLNAGVLIGLSVPFWGAILPGFSRTSSFILECVKWYLDHGEEKRAKNLAQVLDYQVWYREWKRNPWFRRFVVESGLVEVSARYAKFNRRMPAG